MDILDIKVRVLGLPSEHKIKAYLSNDTIVTFYPVNQVLSIHSVELGGLGRFSVDEYAHPEIIEQLMNEYRAEIKNI